MRVGYADYYLSRKFKKELKIGIGDYIKFARIDYACALLTTTDLPIHEIAARLKFCSSTHFSDAFRSVLGKLPQQYRQENQKNIAFEFNAAALAKGRLQQSV